MTTRQPLLLRRKRLDSRWCGTSLYRYLLRMKATVECLFLAPQVLARLRLFGNS